MPIRSLFFCLLLLLTGCGSTGADSSGPASYHYSNEWWYDDYLYYWHHYYPNCCHGDGEYKDMVTDWWQSLDPDKQQEIKNKFDNWQGDRADIADNLPAVKAQLDQKWQSLPPETQQRVRQQLQTRREQGPVDRSAIRANRPAVQRGMMNRPNIGAGQLRGLGGGGLRGRM
ncbi:hypothetical protein L6J37_09890 [Photobacterium sp. WH77]|uniref:hypothetical protein n=1 Tax=unclassified Photobacterium TaxID=2628852 RepID=UPI001EDBD462|nr:MULTISPECIES: hypothetical protein [unclassified Photobacterium]MCG2837142.1 hypothetical protein [Photobacterium sp. WH77]MCG2844708.1 hypothetical protein [Photobacterium sp. WH80]